MSPIARPSGTFRPAVERLDDRITPALSFAAQQSFDTGNHTQAVATADVNQDGRPDMVVVNQYDATVSVLLNTTAAGSSTATFATPQAFGVGAVPYNVAIGDFNGDGRPDVVVPNYNDGTVSVLRNTTEAGANAPSFAAQATFGVNTTYGNPGAVAVGDFDGDGRDDIAIAGKYHLDVLLNLTPVGGSVVSFAPAQYIDRGQFPSALVVADFNGDGRDDIAASLLSDYQSYYWIDTFLYTNVTVSTASAVRFAKSTVTVGGGSSYGGSYLGLAAADFNADGRPDLALTDTTATVRVLTNATTSGGAPTFTNSTFLMGAVATRALVSGDFDGDGRIDLVVGNNTGTITVLVNTTSPFSPIPTFGNPSPISYSAVPVALSAADFNGDGRVDLAAANGTANSATVLMNSSTGGTVTGPSLVGQFGSNGVWRYNRASGGWDQLTAANADALAVAPNGRVVASFGDNGVWYFDPAYGWYLINGHRATAVAIDGLGNAAASFPGFGTALYSLATGWSAPLTSIVADKLAMNAGGKLAASFAGYGLYTYTPAGGWTTLLNGQPAAALAIAANGDVVASLPGYGTYQYAPTTNWRLLNGVAATALATGGDGSVVASFSSYGVAKYIPYASGWQVLHTGTSAPSVAMDLSGNVFVSLSGYGLYEYRAATGWKFLSFDVPRLFAVG